MTGPWSPVIVTQRAVLLFTAMEWRTGNQQQGWIIVSAYWLHFATVTETIIPPIRRVYFCSSCTQSRRQINWSITSASYNANVSRGTGKEAVHALSLNQCADCTDQSLFARKQQYNQLFLNRGSVMLTRPQSPTCQPISWMQFSLRQGWVADGFGSIRQAKSWAWEPCCVLQVTVRVWTPSPQLAEHCRKGPNNYKEAPGFHLHFQAVLSNTRAERHSEAAWNNQPSLKSSSGWELAE